MIRKLILLTSLILLGQAAAMRIEMPWPSLVVHGDAIVTATVETIGEPAEGTMTINKQERKGHFRKVSLVIKEVWYDPSGTLKVGETFEASCQAPTPEPPEAAVEQRPQIIAGAAQVGAVLQVRPRMADGPSYHQLLKNGDYAFTLKKTPQGWYVETQPEAVVGLAAGNESTVNNLRRVADVQSWGWSEAKDGLQLAVVTSTGEERITQRHDGKLYYAARFFACIVLRNVSEKPIAVPLYDCLAFSYMNADNKQFDLPAQDPRFKRPPFADKTFVEVVQPGQMLMIAPDGTAPYGLNYYLRTMPGHVTVNTVFAPKQEGERTLEDGTKLPYWSGTLKAETTYEVTGKVAGR